MTIQGKVVVVTGASSGIGESTARVLAKAGAKVVLSARRTERLEQTVSEIRAAGGEAVYRTSDVTSKEQMKSLADFAVEQYGRLDVWVNNAGLMPLSYLNKLKIDEWDRMIDVNIKGVLYGMAAAIPIMEKQGGGHIINVSSVAGHRVGLGGAVYSGTKFAVRAITEGLRMELSPTSRIRATIISPGMVETELLQTITDEDAMQALKARAPIQQPLRGEDIANAIAYAIDQPETVSVNEILIRPTEQGS
ncbi:SDR family oxidoreductase [Alicyclobacillus cycloheptanicus]|uniref:NADP-dependent 3-hydroxy acid dehydrogenase YdfG n=1 Tax=Alicyclobacillus cycloheptanicus TaxID=1457 RepID=A0ABT9XI02_9BACL|nr:SDR family oxidoreductase [Alicyclobacillus cycloheptanicus]MDQ0189740.1 NADP-dependent 3-hydroxy acid dehydrogenase YdfG [Alicyclobacillus cycloheptanicus]WDM01950.1 SDR family oxidoreductase [Alicyclobacillus cycloheptanicus]